MDLRTGVDVEFARAWWSTPPGPWSDAIRRMAEPQARRAVRGTKGVHVAVPRERIRNNGALTLLSPIDGRVMFVLPAGAFSIIGTTDTDYDGRPERVRATNADVTYLLARPTPSSPARISRRATSSPRGPASVRSSRASDKDPGAASREHAIAWTVPGCSRSRAASSRPTARWRPT